MSVTSVTVLRNKLRSVRNTHPPLGGVTDGVTRNGLKI
jgi:hypothetical protein